MRGEYKRILIVEVNWLGDVLFSTPFIKAVRKKFKDAHIACMVAPRAKEVLEGNPHIDEIIIYDEKGAQRSVFGKLCLIGVLRRKRFDLAILLHRSLTRTLMAVFAGISERAGYATPKRRPFLTLPLEPGDPDLHKVEYFLRIAEHLGCDISEKGCEFFVTEKNREYIKGELSEAGITEGDLLVVINPGGNWPPKRWGEENFAKLGDILIKGYKAKVVLSGADTDKARAERIKGRMAEDAVILAGRTGLKDLAALTERADFVISGDSGPMHIAVAMKSNVIALFGPTSPGLTGPYGEGNYRVVRSRADCEVPCYELACRDYKCMDAITVEDVVEAFEGMREGTYG
jgi:lipopolysaccharide heptosyltransferase II